MEAIKEMIFGKPEPQVPPPPPTVVERIEHEVTKATEKATEAIDRHFPSTGRTPATTGAPAAATAVKPKAPAAGGRPFMTPSLFKDYNKATKDILTKNYSGDGVWKVECKHKAPKNAFTFNPVADYSAKKSGITCDVEYTHEHGGSVKVNVTPELLKNVKSTASYTHDGHKFEGVLHLKDDKVLYELSHQTCVLLQKRASLNEKLTNEVVELGLGVDVAPRCQVGAGAVYSIKNKSCNWNFGCRYFNTHACEMAIQTNKLKTFTTSASGPLNFAVKDKQVKLFVAAETVCGHGRQLEGKLGVESKCLVFPANVVKARVELNKKWALSYISNLRDNWSVAVTIDHTKKPGVVFTHS